jgi:hypothetical protein
MLITVTGRKSGRTYSIPVNYLRKGDTLWITSRRDRTWWRNLKGGAPVQVLLAGRELKAFGEAITHESAVAESLGAYFQLAPQTAKYFGVALDPDGTPSPSDLSRAAQSRIVVRIDLLQPPAAISS